MENQIIAALLLSSAMITAPTFADNANLGNDVENRAGPNVLTRTQARDQLIAARKAEHNATSNDKLYYPRLADKSQGKNY
jgi:hypothetical protein